MCSTIIQIQDFSGAKMQKILLVIIGLFMLANNTYAKEEPYQFLFQYDDYEDGENIRYVYFARNFRPIIKQSKNSSKIFVDFQLKVTTPYEKSQNKSKCILETIYDDDQQVISEKFYFKVGPKDDLDEMIENTIGQKICIIAITKGYEILTKQLEQKSKRAKPKKKSKPSSDGTIAKV